MTASPAPGSVMTAEEVMQLPDDGQLYELDEGRLIVLSPAAYWSGTVAAAFAVRIGSFILEHRLGIFAGPDGGMLLSRGPDTLRAPDFSFVRRERLPGGVARRGYFPGTPDFAIEVLSPTDRFAELSRKVYQYLDAGTSLVWVVDPDARTVVIFRPGQAPQIVGPGGALAGEEVLPGSRSHSTSSGRNWAPTPCSPIASGSSIGEALGRAGAAQRRGACETIKGTINAGRPGQNRAITVVSDRLNLAERPTTKRHDQPGFRLRRPAQSRT